MDIKICKATPDTRPELVAAGGGAPRGGTRRTTLCRSAPIDPGTQVVTNCGMETLKIGDRVRRRQTDRPQTTMRKITAFPPDRSAPRPQPAGYHPYAYLMVFPGGGAYPMASSSSQISRALSGASLGLILAGSSLSGTNPTRLPRCPTLLAIWRRSLIVGARSADARAEQRPLRLVQVGQPVYCLTLVMSGSIGTGSKAGGSSWRVTRYFFCHSSFVSSGGTSTT
jgi:hypothetical protein